MLSIRTYAALALPLALAATGAAVSPALAQGGSGGGGAAVRASGTCSAGSAWTLKAKHDDNRIEVELEVDSNRVGQSWTWRLNDNGALVAHGTARTVAPSGSFSMHRLVGNKAGPDILRFLAKNPATGEGCTGSVRL